MNRVFALSLVFIFITICSFADETQPGVTRCGDTYCNEFGLRIGIGTTHYRQGEAQLPTSPANDLFEYNFRGPLASEQGREMGSLESRILNHPDLARSQDAVRRALEFWVQNKDRIRCDGPRTGQAIDNKRFIIVTDYTLPNTEKRQFIIDLMTGQVRSTYSAHGYGSNYNCPPEHIVNCGGDGQKCAIPATFTNECGEGTTLSGFFTTAESYESDQESFDADRPADAGNHNAVRLEGLQNDRNSTARACGKVWHTGAYSGNACSNSGGCPTTEPEVFWEYRDMIKEGALFYNHTIEEERNPSQC
jgi:hypothetical protein